MAESGLKIGDSHPRYPQTHKSLGFLAFWREFSEDLFLGWGCQNWVLMSPHPPHTGGKRCCWISGLCTYLCSACEDKEPTHIFTFPLSPP